MELANSNFIRQTAFDYDLPVLVVEKIYRNSTTVTDFYNNLELEIKKQIEERTDGKS